MKRVTLTVIGITLLVLLPGQSFGYRHCHCLGENLRWSGNGKTLYASPVSFPAGSVWRNAIQEAVNRHNINPSRFNYYLRTDSGGVRRNNGTSEIWGSSDSGVTQGAPAIAYYWYTCYWFFGDHVKMDEVDIVFNYSSPWRWTASTNKRYIWNYGGGGRPMQTTALHEMGHGLYLGHVNYEYNIMGSDYTHIHVNGGTARAYFGEDGSDGLVHLYGLRSPYRQDVGAVHWKHSGASGEYSRHAKTRLYTSGGSLINSYVTVNGERHYRVNRGQQVLAEFTYENNGASNQTSNLAFYVSTNDYISTWDRRLRTAAINQGRNSVYTTRHRVTIPNDLVRGRNYWLGVIIDWDGRLAETAEWNNATYIPIRIN